MISLSLSLDSLKNRCQGPGNGPKVVVKSSVICT